MKEKIEKIIAENDPVKIKRLSNLVDKLTTEKLGRYKINPQELLDFIEKNTLKDTAKHFKITTVTARAYLKSLDYPRFQMIKSETKIDEIKELRKKGLNVKQIAFETGLGISAVYGVLAKIKLIESIRNQENHANFKQEIIDKIKAIKHEEHRGTLNLIKETLETIETSNDIEEIKREFQNLKDFIC